MNNPNKDAHCSSGHGVPGVAAITKKDYPSEVEEIFRQEAGLLFDTASCRVKAYAKGIAECLSPELCATCGYSTPTGNAFLCRHPRLVLGMPG